MVIFNRALQDEVRALGAIAQGQDPPPLPSATVLMPDSSGTDSLNTLSQLPPPSQPEILPPPALRDRYVAMRSDLIAHGGEKLQAILTEQQYSEIRRRFDLGDASENARQIAALDPDSRKALNKATLRDVVELTQETANNPQFATKKKFLDAFLTPKSDIDRQIRNFMGYSAYPAGPNSSDTAEHSINVLFNAYCDAQHINEKPKLYILRTTPETPLSGISNMILKDGTSLLIVDPRPFHDDPRFASKMLHEAIDEGKYAENEKISKFLAQHKGLSLADFLTAPDFKDMRRTLNLDKVPGTDKDITPDYIASLDATSRALLYKQKVKDAIETRTGQHSASTPYSAYRRFAKNADVDYDLLPSADHGRIIDWYDGAGDFDSEHNRKITRVVPSELEGKEKEFYEHYADMTTNKRKMGLKAVPELYTRNYDSGTGANAWLLKDATTAIVMDSELSKLSPEIRLAVLAHESAHFIEARREHLHTIYDNMRFSKHESMNQKIETESKADEIGWGARGSCDPGNYIKVFQDAGSAQSLLDDQLNLLAMGRMDHPLTKDRIEAAEHAHPGNCVPYYKPTVTGPDR